MLTKEERLTLVALVENTISTTNDEEYKARLESILMDLLNENGVEWLGEICYD